MVIQMNNKGKRFGIAVAMILVVLALYLSVFKYPVSMVMRAGSMFIILFAALILGVDKKAVNNYLG